MFWRSVWLYVCLDYRDKTEEMGNKTDLRLLKAYLPMCSQGQKFGVRTNGLLQ